MRLNINKKLILFAILIMPACFVFINEANAQTYYATGTLISRNLFSPAADTAASINFFGYHCTTTVAATLRVQFSQDQINWFSSTGALGGWDTLSHGNHLATTTALNLAALNWSGPYFYYRILFETSDTSVTPILDEIRLHYTTGTAPTVITQIPDPIFARTATARGNITDDGGGAILERGFQYGLTPTPTWSVSETGTWWPSEGIYSLNITGLEPNTTYHIRAFAVNPAGTSHGSWVSFTTSPVGYYSTGYLVSKNLFSPAADTVASINFFGYHCTTTVAATLRVQFSQDQTNWFNSTGTLGGWDTLLNGNRLATGDALNLAALNWRGPYFHYRILLETSDISVTPILDEIRLHYTLGIAPTVITQIPDPIFARTAAARGNITDDGGGAILERGFQYGLTPTPTWTVSETGTWWPSEGIYSLNLTGLEPNTTYHIRAYVRNPVGTSHGSWMSFTTSSIGYYSTGYLVSRNLFSGETVRIINNFFTSSTVPVGTSLWVQFSTTGAAWHSAEGVLNEWTFVPHGQTKFILYHLNWSGPNFFYRMRFETFEAGKTPILDEIQLNYNIFHSPHLKGSIRLRGGVILE